ncbi:MAG: hypothetical protein ACX931_06510 [Saccharospirillum sp.]
MPWLVALSLAASAEVFTWTDLNLGADAYAYPELRNAGSDNQPPGWALDQRLDARWNLSAHPTPDLEFGLHYGLAQRWRLAQDDGETEFDRVEPSGPDFRLWDLDAELYSDEDGRLVLEQNLDRLYLLWHSDRGDLAIGRQAISFGLSRQFSPVDVVLPANIGARERSYRPGVDAVRWLQPLGQVGELDLGWVVGDDQLVFGRSYSPLGSLMLELTALTVNADHHLLGLGTQGAVGAWGWWQELAWLVSDAEQAVRLTLGTDQQVLDDLYLVLEYHFNGAGRHPADLASVQSNFYRKGMVVPLGRHYVSALASQPLTPLLSVQGNVLINLGDGSTLLNAGLDYSLSDNSRLDVGISLPVAEAPAVLGSEPGTVRLGDEFGVYPARISVNWSTVF